MTCVSKWCVVVGIFVACPILNADLDLASPKPLNANASSDSGADILPVLATDRSGHWVTVWSSNDTLGNTVGSDYDIFVARSSNNGLTWTPPIALNLTAGSDNEEDLSPAIATDGNGHWVAVWSSDNHIAAATSVDNGETWTSPNELTDNGENPRIATDSAGNWLVVWEAVDTLDELLVIERDILMSRSTNNGATWSVPAPVNNYANNDQASGGLSGVDDLRACIATDGRGAWLAAWEWHAGYDADLLVAISKDNGQTWTDPDWLNSNYFNDDGADYAPQLTTDSKGNWVAVWWSNEKYKAKNGKDARGATSDFNILISRSKNNGKSWTLPKPLNNNAWTDKGGDYRPTVSTDGKGTWIAAWESDETFGDTIGKDDDMLFAISTDNGRKWTDPALFNTNAASDERDDGAATLANDGGGSWIAAWHSKDTLQGSIGKDFDILTTAFTSPPLPILVRIPNDGEVWTAGDAHKIRWSLTDAAGPKVKIELLRDNALVAVIKEQTPNDGSYNWNVDSSLAPGNDYRVRITATNDNAIVDESDGTFRIVAHK